MDARATLSKTYLKILRGSRGEFCILPICLDAERRMMARLGTQMTLAIKKNAMKRLTNSRYI
jgi:hypothetical protein